MLEKIGDSDHVIGEIMSTIETLSRSIRAAAMFRV